MTRRTKRAPGGGMLPVGVWCVTTIVVASVMVLASCGASPQASTPRDQAGVRLTADAPDDAATSTVILTGAIGDHGTATTLDDHGQIDATHRSQWQLDLQHGTFRIDIADIGRQLAAAFAHSPIDPVTCSGHVEVAASAAVVASSGTAYKEITGSFDLTITVDEVVLDAPHTCDATSPIAAQSVHTIGTGNLQVP